jgi:uncharacterized protein YegL
MGLNNLGLGDVPAVSARPLEFIWVLDTSGSMDGSKIQALNFAIRDSIPAMKEVASNNPNAQIFMRAMQFDEDASWVGNRTPLDSFSWKDLSTGGGTNLGDALDKLITALDVKNMPQRGLPPVIVLISDGMPNDDQWKSKLTDFLSLPWGKHAVRIAISIGEDADDDMLSKFVNNPEIPVLKANNATDLKKYIRWVSTTVLSSASASKTSSNPSNGNVALPQPPAPTTDPNDVF